jgi:hypothetical protein
LLFYLWGGGTGIQQLIRRLTVDTEVDGEGGVEGEGGEPEGGAGEINMPPPGAPFSALLASMLPEDIGANIFLF